MVDNEGSLITEDSDDESEESGTEQSDEQSSEGSKEQEVKDSTEEAKAESGTLTEEKTEVTEKGTKLDSNPLSAVNQQLANERAKVREYEKVLNDPKVLKNYVATFEKDEKPQEEEMQYKDVQTTEDLHKFLAQQDRKVQDKLKELDSTINSVKTERQSDQVATRISSDIQVVRETYKELDPKSDEFNPELDKAVGELYDMYDFDKETETYKGNVSIKDIADKIMKAAGSSKKQGSTEAQTIIRDKRTGKAVSGSSSQTADEGSMTPGQLIAHRIKQASGGR